MIEAEEPKKWLKTCFEPGVKVRVVVDLARQATGQEGEAQWKSVVGVQISIGSKSLLVEAAGLERVPLGGWKPHEVC